MRIPESASIIHCQLVAETMIGSSHGTRNRPRSTMESGKLRRKNTASASPIVYWKNNDTTTKKAVCSTIGQNCRRADDLAVDVENPTNGALPGHERRPVEAVQAHRDVLVQRVGVEHEQVDQQRRDEGDARPSRRPHPTASRRPPRSAPGPARRRRPTTAAVVGVSTLATISPSESNQWGGPRRARDRPTSAQPAAAFL